MPTTPAQRKAADRYIKSTFDEIKTRVPKGQKEVIQAHAADRGESVNGFINRAIDNQIKQDNSEPTVDAQPPQQDAQPAE